MDNLFIATGTLILPGVLTAISVFALFCMVGIRKVVGYHVLVDVLFSTGLCIVYAGTFAGMIAAFSGGLLLGILMWFIKGVFGYELFNFKTWKWEYHVGW